MRIRSAYPQPFRTGIPPQRSNTTASRGRSAHAGRTSGQGARAHQRIEARRNGLGQALFLAQRCCGPAGVERRLDLVRLQGGRHSRFLQKSAAITLTAGAKPLPLRPFWAASPTFDLNQRTCFGVTARTDRFLRPANSSPGSGVTALGNAAVVPAMKRGGRSRPVSSIPAFLADQRDEAHAAEVLLLEDPAVLLGYLD